MGSVCGGRRGGRRRRDGDEKVGGEKEGEGNEGGKRREKKRGRGRKGGTERGKGSRRECVPLTLVSFSGPEQQPPSGTAQLCPIDQSKDRTHHSHTSTEQHDQHMTPSAMRQEVTKDYMDGKVYIYVYTCTCTS